MKFYFYSLYTRSNVYLCAYDIYICTLIYTTLYIDLICILYVYICSTPFILLKLKSKAY